MSVLTRTATTAERALPCARCAVVFRPALTAGECPVCGWHAERAAQAGVGGWLADPGNRVVTLVVAATVANGVLLTVLALQVGRAG